MLEQKEEAKFSYELAVRFDDSFISIVNGDVYVQPNEYNGLSVPLEQFSRSIRMLCGMAGALEEERERNIKNRTVSKADKVFPQTTEEKNTDV